MRHYSLLFALTLVVAIAAEQPSAMRAQLAPTSYRPHAASESTLSASIQGFDLVSETEGWLWMGQHVYWTTMSGGSWDDITPLTFINATILAASFPDTRHGWLIGAGMPKGDAYTLAHTSDSGKTWQTSPLSFPEVISPNVSVGAMYLYFLDSQWGWLVVKQSGGANFSRGWLFRTTDGGNTWTQLSIPIGEPVYFVDRETGWVAGGAAGNELYRTVDGGRSWLSQSATASDRQKVYLLPKFDNTRIGALPVIVSNGAESQVELYATSDGGQTWNPARRIPLGQEISPGSAIPLAMVDSQQAVLVIPGSNRVVLSQPDGTMLAKLDPLIANITELDMATPAAGWAVDMSGNCAPQQDSIHCVSEARLLRTDDGGQTWRILDTPLPSRLSTTLQDAIVRAPQGIGDRTQTFTGQGFDACEVANQSQLQTWITSSPYRAVNLYIGGSCRACSNAALSASFVSQLHQQGWKFIPTWVGPQASCSSLCVGNRISSDPTTAYNQGVNEANAAINVAYNLGLTAPDKSGTVIYYDLEQYDTGDTTCHNAAQSFISGWTARLRALGNQAGLYGYGPAINASASLPNVPDVIWPAHWIFSSYNASATVWNAYGIPNTNWSNHQRIRQYAGGHNETWGGVTLNIDCNVADGVVAVYSVDQVAPTTASSSSGTVGENGWYVSSVQVTLSASDNSGGSGVKLTQYKIDAGNWQNYSGAFTVSVNGNYTVYYKSQDNAGNWEVERSTTLKIDTTAPTGSLVINNNDSVSYATLVRLHTLGSDMTSGISHVRLRDAGGAWSDWQTYASTTIWQLSGPTGQSFTVESQYKDSAGNLSPVYNDAISLNVYPARPSSASYRLARSTLGVSGNAHSSANYRLGSTFGQPSMIGSLSSSGYRLTSGYWLAASLNRRVFVPVVRRGN